MSILESGEMYLETILILKKKMKNVRSIDVARHLNYSRPSVSRAMALLRENEYITVDDKGFIDFTEKGQKTVDEVYEKHVVLTELFKGIGVSPETAEEDACRIEHIISEETFKKLKEHISKMK